MTDENTQDQTTEDAPSATILPPAAESDTLHLAVERFDKRHSCTIGRLYADNAMLCYTLEDQVRPEGADKVFGQTAIPYGTYAVSITFSPHFQRDLPLLADVPNFDGVRIHPGNTAADTEGCLLVGKEIAGDALLHSRDAFDAVYPLIEAAIAAGKAVTIEYKDAA